VVVYDSLPDAIKYNTCQDMTGVMPVHMVCPKETRPLAGRQVDPLLFGFFHYPGMSYSCNFVINYSMCVLYVRTPPAVGSIWYVLFLTSFGSPRTKFWSGLNFR